MKSIDTFAKILEFKYPSVIVSLLFVILGAAFLLISALDGNVTVGSVSISIDPDYDGILLKTGFAFVMLAFLPILIGAFAKDSTSRENQSTDRNSTSNNGRVLVRQKQQIDDLNKALENIDKLTADQNDYVSKAVQSILHTIGQTLVEIRERPRRLDLLGQWIEERKNYWIKNIPKSAYKKIRWSKKGLFFSEMEAHINLLKENILRGRFHSPRKVGISRHLSDPTPYIRSLAEIEKLALEDLYKTDPNILGGDERATFVRYMRRFIEDM